MILSMQGERLQSHRLLRVVKNRYGSTDEVLIFFERFDFFFFTCWESLFAEDAWIVGGGVRDGARRAGSCCLSK